MPAPDDVTVRAFVFERGDEIPNHPRWPLLIYEAAVPHDADAVERQLAANGWGGTWRDGVYSYHHYHSTSHEVLAVVRGTARVQFGGPQGEAVQLAAGDVAILPAGTGHKRLDASDGFLVVGAYPRGQEDPDLRRDAPSDADLERIAQVVRPASDPVFGEDGPLLERWPNS